MKKQFFIGFLFIICTSCLNKKNKDENPILGEEVVTFMVEALPVEHNFEDDIYISGDFEGWSGGRVQFKLQNKAHSYVIDIPKYRETINFKFTQGKWGTEECQINGNPIENRTYSFNKLKDTIRIDIEKWNNAKNLDKPSTAADNVQVFYENFKIPQLNRERKISVYLPPNYSSSNEEFPVLYILDGQNVFDTATSYSGEWEVDETLNKIFNETGFGLIVVAIDHGGNMRLNEYSAWDNKKYGKGEGEFFLNFLTNTLKPEIDRAFRTKKEPHNTVIMGSSMGGLFAHYAVTKRPNVFGKAGIFSPSFWYNQAVFKFTNGNYSSSKSRLYYLVGSKEGDNMVEPTQEMVSLMQENGFPKENILSKVVPDGTHSESFWKLEFRNAIEWLFATNKD